MAFQLPRLLLPLLLFLAGAVDVMGESTTSYHDDTCPPDTTITDQDGQEDIEWTRQIDTELMKYGYAYVDPDQIFKGLSLRVTLHSKTPSSTTPVQDTQEGFFPLNDTCFWDDATLWWLVDAWVELTSPSSNEHDGGQDLTFELRVGLCKAKCVVQLQEESRLYTWQWTAYGPSRWRKNRPGGECKTRIPERPLKEYNSCLKPPGTTQHTTATPNGTEDTTATPNGTEDTTATPNGTEDTTATPNGTEDTTATPNGTEDTTATPNGTEDTTATQDDTISILMIIILSMLTGAVGVVGFFGLKIINTEIQQRSG